MKISLYSCQILMKLEFPLHIFEKFSNIKFHIKQANTMQLGGDLYYCTSWLLYTFRAPLAPIIRSTTTVYAASGTSHTSDNRLPTWPSLKSVT